MDTILCDVKGCSNVSGYTYPDVKVKTDRFRQNDRYYEFHICLCPKHSHLGAYPHISPIQNGLGDLSQTVSSIIVYSLTMEYGGNIDLNKGIQRGYNYNYLTEEGLRVLLNIIDEKFYAMGG